MWGGENLTIEDQKGGNLVLSNFKGAARNKRTQASVNQGHYQYLIKILSRTPTIGARRLLHPSDHCFKELSVV